MPVLNIEQAVLHRGIIPPHEKTLPEEGPVEMRRPGSRVQIGISLTLGVLAGIALLSIPALLTPPTQQASNIETEGLSPALSFADRSTGPETTGPASTATSDKVALGLGLFLVLLPASVLSLLTRKWAVRKLEQY